MKPTVRKTLVALLIASTASFGLATPAQADNGVRHTAQQQLITHGVNPADAQARIAAMTDDEAAELAAHIDHLPAGGFDWITGTAVLFMSVPVVVALLPFMVVGGIVALAIKNRGAGNAEVAATATAENP